MTDERDVKKRTIRSARRQAILRRCGLLLLLFAALFAATLLGQPRWLFVLANRLFPSALYAVQQGPDQLKAIALTIDDGPSPATVAILAALDRHDAQATFFNISDNLSGHESIVQQAINSGHELGNHLTADEPSIRLDIDDFEAALLTAEAAFLPYLPQDSQLRWLRPGMGVYNTEMVEVAQRHGYQIVLGSTFPYDTHIHSSRFAGEFILRTVQPGDIVVLHDGEERGIRTARTLAIVLPELQERGYKVTTLSDLVKSER